MEYEVRLDKYSGPLEKLLELIERKHLEITVINLGKVTGDFLDYLKQLEEKHKHPSVLADFIVVASRLLLIKSKAILPTLELTDEEETDIKDLESRLRIYKEFKGAGLIFKNLWEKKHQSYGRELFTDLPPVFYPAKNISIKDLEKEILGLIKELKGLIPEKETVKKVVLTIEQKVQELLSRLKDHAEESFNSASKNKSKIEVIILFLAMLHLLRDRIITADQRNQFGDIRMKK